MSTTFRRSLVGCVMSARNPHFSQLDRLAVEHQGVQRQQRWWPQNLIHRTRLSEEEAAVREGNRGPRGQVRSLVEAGLPDDLEEM